MNFIETVYASETAETAAEGAASEGLFASLGINPSLLGFQALNFALVIGIVWFLILKPLTKKMAERQKLIDEGLDNAKKVQETLQKSERAYQEKIDQAKVEANRLIEKAGADALSAGEETKNRARRDIEVLIQQARNNIKAERDEAAAELKKEVAEIIALSLQKLIKEKMTSAKDKELIEDTLKNING